MSDAFPLTVAWGVKYGNAMQCKTREEAFAYFERMVDHCLRSAEAAGKPMTREEAVKLERHNLGYWGGYYSNEERARMEALFECEHPFFGSIAKNGPPEDPLEIGMKLGAELAKR